MSGARSEVIVKVPVDELRIGMYVQRLDRPWKDTPFLLHRFRIKSEQQLQTLRDYCAYAYVNNSKGRPYQPAISASSEPSQSRPADASPPPQAASQRRPCGATQRQAYERHCSVVRRLFEDVRFGKALDYGRSQQVVEQLLLELIQDQQGMLYLSQMQRSQQDLAQKSVNVCIMTLAFARHIGIQVKRLPELGQGALLHDIGLLWVPKDILDKRGRLTPAERRQIERHCEYGLDILKRNGNASKLVRQIVHGHHERVDGQGYPCGLSSKDTPLEARMVGIVCIYEALTRQRRYGTPVSPTTALRKIFLERGKGLDARLVDKFIHMLGLYPPGCFVLLSDQRYGVIMEGNETARDKPKVLVIGRYPGDDFEQPELLDLGQTALEITKPLEPDDPGISSGIQMLGV